MSDPPCDPQPDADPATDGVAPQQLRVQRAPRYPVFLLSGAVLGVLVAIVSGLSGSSDSATSRGALVGYLSVGLGLLGALLGGAVAVLLDRRRR